VLSLLEQSLPPEVEWGELWVVASGCTNRTVEVAMSVARRRPEVQVLVEPVRGGKARALRQVVARARGDGLVLLNADAEAAPGSVGELLHAASAGAASPPYAVMARPVPRFSTEGARGRGIVELLWELHHDFHVVLADEGGGAHLSDELLLLGLPLLTSIPEGTVNDGSYLGVWMAQHDRPRLYAPGASVLTQAPGSLPDHPEQRRRIRFGNGQVRRLLGAAPTTLAGMALRRPGGALCLLARASSRRRDGSRELLALCAAELTSYVLSEWDRLPPPRDHVRWRRIARPAVRSPPTPSGAAGAAGGPSFRRLSLLERRVEVLTRVARLFETAISPTEFVRLLPREGPASIEEVRSWVERHPELASIEDGSIVAAGERPRAHEERLARGRSYVGRAERLLEGPFRPSRRWAHCLALSGSAAYGEPQPRDDLDLFVVTRQGALWWFLVCAYVGLRLDRIRTGSGDGPTPCLNYVVDDLQARQDFRASQGLLFAREALAVRPLWGEEYYRGLLSTASWIGAKLPRLYAERTDGPQARVLSNTALPWRLLNAAVYPWLATYLQLRGLARNAGYRRAGRWEAQFRTETRPHRLTFASRRFDSLRALYEDPAAQVAPRGIAGGGGTPWLAR
jgi:hypothetical protein